MCKKKEKNLKKCTIKCGTCQFYDKHSDFCTEKEIENVSKQVNTDFAQCSDFLVKDSLIMF
jgi:hypothetical protein